MEGFVVIWRRGRFIAQDPNSSAAADGESPSEACRNLAMLLLEYWGEGILSPCKPEFKYRSILKRCLKSKDKNLGETVIGQF